METVARGEGEEARYPGKMGLVKGEETLNQTVGTDTAQGGAEVEQGEGPLKGGDKALCEGRVPVEGGRKGSQSCLADGVGRGGGRESSAEKL